jgi:hypothetical protein
MKNPPIKEICAFAYATKGEALEIANKTMFRSAVAAIHILNGYEPAKKPVAWIVVPHDFDRGRLK